MEKIKSLLLPLALVFAAIAVFEFGARYGATNMRAYAIASELQFPLNIYEQAGESMDARSKETFATMIDNGIAVGSMHRNIWYLKKDARAKLDKVLARAFSARGDATCERFANMQNSEDLPSFNKNKLSEICAAVDQAKIELAEAPSSIE
ncbi:hypothetical protein SH580_14970 [Coraliomargarita algicola]|uniref:Uncharacterized protein n=1 Tax=Coraliomargarita algicola TaxID=3092156 RepID=A0ABZ0RIA4_9BACT|nr:hypothetical protein [Coraliomargarita sp. J2-16]WPJ94735.1 hypothetical protein SH580_14970 [Coraliomargarita sp. J2-16]